MQHVHIVTFSHFEKMVLILSLKKMAHALVIHSFIHLFIIYLLNNYYVSGMSMCDIYGDKQNRCGSCHVEFIIKLW